MVCRCEIAQLAHYLATRPNVLLAIRGTHIRKKVKFSTAKSTPRPVHRVLVDISSVWLKPAIYGAAGLPCVQK
jgi:hypothetical protein